jgi:thioredoxin-like negative regulator of GroEL
MAADPARWLKRVAEGAPSNQARHYLRMERLTAADFEGTTLSRDGTLAVTFSAKWCPYCRDFMAEFKTAELSVEKAMGDVTDEESALWDDFELNVVPTMVLFRDGEAVWRRDGIRRVGLNGADIDALRAAL